jgi:hypothetical protein
MKDVGVKSVKVVVPAAHMKQPLLLLNVHLFDLSVPPRESCVETQLVVSSDLYIIFYNNLYLYG